MSEELPRITYWLLDTRSLWPGENIRDAALDALDLISEDERASVLRKYFIADARMTLASTLLKRLFISRSLNVPFASVRLGRRGDPKHGKPCAVGSDNKPLPVEFNVSHQAGLVALVGCTMPGVELGVDITCVNERNDYRTIDEDGFDGWVDMHAEVFGEGEQFDMKYSVDAFPLLDGTEVTPAQLGRLDRCCVRDKDLSIDFEGRTLTFSSDLLIDAKLRRFYTFWCYKEAYIKLTGEALLAEWIKECEFRNVRAPKPGTVPRCSVHGIWGEVVEDAEVWLHGKKLDNVVLQIQGMEENYMLAVAARPTEALGRQSIPAIKRLNLEEDVMAIARKC